MPFLINEAKTTIDIKPEQMATFAAVANFLAPLRVGLHCERWQQDFRGSNANQDQFLAVECGCREFKVENPHRQVVTFDRVISQEEALNED